MRRFSEPVEVRVASARQPSQPGGVLAGDDAATGPARDKTGAVSAGDVAGVSAGDAAGVPSPPEAFIWRDRLYVVGEVLGQWRERRAWWRDADEVAAAARERYVWRVAASRGRAFGAGVYDLALGDDWRLVRVCD